MKKVVMTLLAVVMVAPLVCATGTGREAQEWGKLLYNKKVDQELVKKFEKQEMLAREEAAKFDFGNLPDTIKKGMKAVLVQKHPQLDHAAFIGEIDSFESYDYSFANGSERNLYTYYFVVTEGDTDYFYAGVREQKSSLLKRKKDTLYETVYMGTAAHQQGLDYKQALEDFKAKLPAPFNKHATALLREVPFTTIESVQAVERGTYENIAGGQVATTTEYIVQYNLKDGTSLEQIFKYSPVVQKSEGTFGYKRGGKVEKI
ncbi:MAG: hypothetical protein J6U96_04040 [Elusimicrobiaceae bacterium]|nr:hypothetical protein [Elusimicrobiaceae bacterium]